MRGVTDKMDQRAHVREKPQERINIEAWNPEVRSLFLDYRYRANIIWHFAEQR